MNIQCHRTVLPITACCVGGVSREEKPRLGRNNRVVAKGEGSRKRMADASPMLRSASPRLRQCIRSTRNARSCISHPVRNPPPTRIMPIFLPLGSSTCPLGHQAHPCQTACHGLDNMKPAQWRPGGWRDTHPVGDPACFTNLLGRLNGSRLQTQITTQCPPSSQ